jgi:NADH-quinone oxidoreductase subunit M
MSILLLIILLPLIGALILAFLPRDDHDDIRGASMVASVVAFVVSLVLYSRFDATAAGMQFVYEAEWMPAIHASFKLGIDGLSLMLIMLTTFLMPITILGSWTSIKSRSKEFHIALLVLEATMIAVFCARDVLLFYVFWEAMLIPMFLLIGIWGSENRIQATIKFFIYTASGSLMMLAAILYIFNQAGSFEITAMAEAARAMTEQEQYWLTVAFCLAFAIKVPLFPLHTWLPHAHVQAPAAGSVQLAAVMLKMGGYGFLRFALPFFPDGITYLAPAIGTLAVIGVIYGALMALAQDDLKRLIAYSSVSHLALVVLGIVTLNTAGLVGAIYQMLAHGLSTGGLFLMVGILYERRHSREIKAYGGLARSAPWLTTMFLITTLASIAVPGTCGFIGEFSILLGAYTWDIPGARYYAVFAASGVVLGASYMLWLVRRIFWGEAHGENQDVADLNVREWVVMLPMVILMLVLGLFPGPIIARLEVAIKPILETMGGS